MTQKDSFASSLPRKEFEFKLVDKLKKKVALIIAENVFFEIITLNRPKSSISICCERSWSYFSFFAVKHQTMADAIIWRVYESCFSGKKLFIRLSSGQRQFVADSHQAVIFWERVAKTSLIDDTICIKFNDCDPWQWTQLCLNSSYIVFVR